MVQRIQKARSREEFEREERLASETLAGGGNKKGLGTNVGGRRRNVAPEALPTESSDYDEENRQMLGGKTETETIQAGTYEDDYGSGVQGRREAGQVGETEDPTKESLSRSEKTLAGGRTERDDFPTGKWSRQKTRAKLSSTPGAAKARKTSTNRPKARRPVKGGGNRGRRTGETSAFRGRNAGGNRPRHTGIGTRSGTTKKLKTAGPGARARGRSVKQSSVRRAATTTKGAAATQGKNARKRGRR